MKSKKVFTWILVVLFSIIVINQAFSITINLQNNVTELIADVYVYNSTGGSLIDGFQTKWNISSIPENAFINSVTHCSYIYAVVGTLTTHAVNVSRIDDQSWTESINLAEFNAQTKTYYNNSKNFSSIVDDTWTCVDVTDLFLLDYGTNDNFTLRFEDNNSNHYIYDKLEATFPGLSFGDNDGNSFVVSSRDYGQGESSYLNITYTDQVNLTILYPINGTNLSYGNIIPLNFTIINSTSLDTCKYSVDSFVTNTSISCTQNATINLTEGNKILTMWANDSVNTQDIFSVNFTIDLTEPNITINSVEKSFGSRTIVFNITVAEELTNLDTCWYSINNSDGGINDLYNNVSYTCNQKQEITLQEFDTTYYLYGFVNDTVGNLNSTYDSFILEKSSGSSDGGGGGSLILTIANTTGRTVNLPFGTDTFAIFLPFKDGTVVYEKDIPVSKKIVECTVSGAFICNISEDQTDVSVQGLIEVENKLSYIIEEELTLVDEFSEVIDKTVVVRVLNLQLYIPVRDTINMDWMLFMGDGFVEIFEEKVIGIRYWWIALGFTFFILFTVIRLRIRNWKIVRIKKKRKEEKWWRDLAKS